MDANFLVIVKVRNGLKIMDTPRPQSSGGVVRRTVVVGSQLYAYGIHNIDGVDYVRLVPQNPQKQEWVRRAEADESIVYVDVIDLQPKDGFAKLADAVNALASAVTLAATAIRQSRM